MKRFKNNLLLFSSLFLTLSITSCKVIEKYVSTISQKESNEIAEKNTTSHNTDSIDDNSLNFYYENTDVADDSFTYEEDIYTENEYISK